MDEKSNRKTKVLAVSDIHGDVEMVKRLAKKAEEENVDLIILAGDLIGEEREIENLLVPFADTGKKVFLLHGNHEDEIIIDLLAGSHSNMENLHGRGFLENGVGIFGVGGVNVGVTSVAEKGFGELIGRAHMDLGDIKKKILVTHMHPSGTKSEFSGFEGSREIMDAIEKYNPDFAIFGHIHEWAGTEEKIGKTKLINVAMVERIFEV